MGVTHVQARVFGELETREYTFMVDTGSTFLALPQKEIDALGLRRGRGVFRLVSATGPVDVETYHADGKLWDRNLRPSWCLPPLPCWATNCCKT